MGMEMAQTRKKRVAPEEKKSLPVLTYWEGRGRAEVIRYILGCAGVEFKENYMRNRADFEKMMPHMLFNQVPLLQINGMDIIQTHAIIRYVATNYGLMPTSKEEITRCNELWEGLRDMEKDCQFVYRNWHTHDSPDKAKEFEKEIAKGLEKWVPKFVGILKAVSKSGYLMNTERPYVCDYIFYYFLECADEFDDGRAVIKANPRAAAYLKQMRERPEVKAHLASSHVHGPTTANYTIEVKASLNWK